MLLDRVDCFVVTEVDVSAVRVDVDLIGGGEMREIRPGGVRLMRCAVLPRLVDRTLRPKPSSDVVRGFLVPEEIQRNTRGLQRRPSPHEQDFVGSGEYH